MGPSQEQVVGELEGLLCSLSSADNAAREEAERTFEQVWVLQAATLIPALALVIASDGADGGAAGGKAASRATIRSLAAILFRRTVARFAAESTSQQPVRAARVRLWSTLEGSVQQECCRLLLSAWQATSAGPASGGAREVCKNVSDAIAQVARIVNVHETWPELVAMLLSVDPSSAGGEGGAQGEVACNALRIIAAVPECITSSGSTPPTGDREHLESVARYLYQFIIHSKDPAVRVGALKALHSILTSIDDESLKAAFAPLIEALPQLFAVLAEAAIGGGAPTAVGVDVLTESFQNVIELIDDCPRIFKGRAQALVTTAMAVCERIEAANGGEGAILEEDNEDTPCYMAAIEMITTLCEAHARTLGKQKELVSGIVVLLLKTSSNNLCGTVASADGKTYSGDWFDASPDDENESEALSLSAEQALDRVSVSVGGKRMLPPLFGTIPGMLASPDWRHRYGALRAIANMAEGCADILSDQLDSLLSIVWPAFHDPHPRVQYAACHALGQLCTDFAGPLQEHFAPLCLDALVSVLVKSEYARVQCHAAAALVNFAEGVDASAIAPVLDGLLERLVGLLSTNVVYLQEQVIATIAAFSTAAGASFTKYVAQVMPLLMQCLTSSLEKSYRQLQGRALEAATIIGESVGLTAAFQPYLRPLLDTMVALQEASLDADDIIGDQLPLAWVRMCQLLQKDFVPFLPLILPGLLGEASAEPDVTIVGEGNDERDYDATEWDFATVRGRRLGIHTATLDMKAAAVDNLTVYIRALKDAFGPFVNETFTVVLPLVSFTMDDRVQCSAIDALASLIQVAYNMACKGDATTAGPSHQQLAVVRDQMVLPTIVSLFDVLADGETYTDLVVATLDGLTDIVNVTKGGQEEESVSGPEGASSRLPPSAILPEDFASRAFLAIDTQVAIIAAKCGPSRAGASRRRRGDDDEGLAEEEVEECEEVLYAISRFAAALFRTYGQAVLGASEGLLQFCLGTIMASAKAAAPRSTRSQNGGGGEEEDDGDQGVPCRHASFCIIADLIQYVGEGTAPLKEYVVQCLQHGISGDAARGEDFDLDIQQAAVYGVGMCAQYAPGCYHAFALAALPTLLSIVEDRDAKAPSRVMLTDNAMSAIARICQMPPAQVNGGSGSAIDNLSAILPRWTVGLPVTHDEDEIAPVYEWLLVLLSAQPSILLSEALAQRTFHALVDVLVKDDTLAQGGDEAASTGAPSSGASLLRRVKEMARMLHEHNMVSPANCQAVLSQYTPEQLAKIQS